MIVNITKKHILSLAMLTALSNGVLYTEPVSAAEDDLDNHSERSNKALVSLTPGSGGTSIRYSSYGATGMTSINSTARSNAGHGCMEASSLIEFDASIDLPDDSRIVSISFNVRDSSDTTSTSARLLSVDASGGFTDIGSYGNTGVTETPGYANLGSYLDYTTSQNEALLGRITLTGENTEACGIRIGYIPPSVASDVIFVNNFYR